MVERGLDDSPREILRERYEVQQQLGKKSGRKTLLARNLETQELVVIKLLTFSIDLEWDDLKLFEREAETLQALCHPAIPRYLNYFELDLPNAKGFALVQSYLEGGSLEDHLKSGRTFSELEVRQLAKALLEILVYLHGRQPPVIHRDIKPSNILLTNRSGNSVGQIYLVDFGSVQTLAAKEGGTITVVGTYGYMSPEQFGGRAVPASDLYSLGAKLIYLITGTHPAELPQKDLRIEFEQAVNLKPALTDWLKWMTEPSLDKRLTSAQEAIKVLEQEQQRESNPLLFKKPTGSKIVLNKNIDSLEIITNSMRVGSRFSGYHSLGWFHFLMFFCCGALPALANAAFAILPSSAPLFCGICYVLWMIWTILKGYLYRKFGRTRLRIDQQQILLTEELLRFKYNLLQPARKQDISMLVRAWQLEEGTLRLERIDASFGKKQTNIKPGIIIWVGTQKIVIGRDGHLSPSETDWLAYELSNWLGLPITKE